MLKGPFGTVHFGDFPVRSLACYARSLVRSFASSLGRSFARSWARSLAPSPSPCPSHSPSEAYGWLSPCLTAGYVMESQIGYNHN